MQPYASRWTSKSPSILLAQIRLPLLLVRVASIPYRTNRLFPQLVFFMLLFSKQAISLLVGRFIWYAPSSSPSRIRAVRFFYLCLPLELSAARTPFSPLLSVTIYFFILNLPRLIMKKICHFLTKLNGCHDTSSRFYWQLL